MLMSQIAYDIITHTLFHHSLTHISTESYVTTKKVGVTINRES